MDSNDSDWMTWSSQVGGDNNGDSQSGTGTLEKSDSVDADMLGDVDDDYIQKYGIYDDYDSFNDESDSSDDGIGDMDDPDTDSYSYQPPLYQPKASRTVLNEFSFINGKEGMATCEMCGAVGVKHAFYSKSKRFCSLACSRGFAAAQKAGKLQQFKKNAHMKQERQKSSKLQSPGVLGAFEWKNYLTAFHTDAAAVTSFKHCPMYDGWENINVGIKIEVINHDCHILPEAYWIATVVRIAGYKALMRYEGYGSDPSNDFWINLCMEDVHPVGWCATIGKPLVPPQTIMHRYVDWKDFLVKRLTGSRTIPNNFYQKVVDGIKNHKFKQNMKVEVVDKMCVSAMRVATVSEIIGGRLRLQYIDHIYDNNDFWCHMKSSLLHYIGWSQQVGHKVHATQEYRDACLGKLAMQRYDADDSTPDMFGKPREVPAGPGFQAGMKLEAIDPLNLSAICVATVMKVLSDNYLMIGIDGSMAIHGTDWFCYHATSPCIFPAGFCEINGLNLTPPKGYKGPFKWLDYLKQTKSQAAPVKHFDKVIPKHGFKVGMKLEAVDLMEPRLICVGTVTRVVGRLLKIHFDGWESEYDQWVDCESPDIYPVGWCDIMGYPIEGPRIRAEPAHLHHQVMNRKRKGKTQIYRGPRKKRKPKLSGGSPTKSGKFLTPPTTPSPGCEQKPLVSENLTSSLVPPLVPQREKQEVTLSINIKQEPETEGYDPLPSLTPLVRSQSQPSTPNLDLALGLKHQNYALSVGSSVHTALTSSRPALAATLLTGSPTTSPTFISASGASASPTVVPSSLVAALSSGSLKATMMPSSTIKPLPTSILTVTKPTTMAVNLPSATAVTKPTTMTANLPSPNTVTKATTMTANLPSPNRLTEDGTKKGLLISETESWSIFDVCHFLKLNDCGTHCESFMRKKIDGKTFLNLSKEQIVNLTGMKVGPSLKIFDLIQLLRLKMMEHAAKTAASQRGSGDGKPV